MDNCENLRIAKSATEIISRFPSVRKVVLFGSTVKGTVHPDSDIDLVVNVRTRGLSERVAVTESIIIDLEQSGISVVLNYNKHTGPWKNVVHLCVYNGEEYFPPDAVKEGCALFQKTEEAK